MIMLSLNKVNKSFGVETILEDISFSVEEGDKVGIVGINGTGKTTLFKVITGIYGYDSGDMYTSKGCRMGYLQQNTNFHSEKTVYNEVLTVFEDLINAEIELREMEEKIASLSTEGSSSNELTKLMEDYGKKYEDFEKRNGYSYKSEVMGTLRGLGFSKEDMDKKIEVLSGGEKTRVLLGKLLLSKPSLLLLDEPTNHLDPDAVEWLEGFLRAYTGTVMLISHDRYFLDQSVNRIFEISNKRLKSYNGNYTEFQKQAKIQKEIELRKFENQQRDIKKQEEAIERLKAYGREKHLKRARSKEKMLDKVERVDKPQEIRSKARFKFKSASQSGNDVLRVKDLEKAYGDEKPLFKGVNFDIYRGEKVALIGPNGVGKSTVFKILINEVIQSAGEFKLGQNVNIGHFDQEQKTLNLSNTIIDEIWDANPKLTQTEIRSLLGAFLFTDEDVFKELTSLSGGERARVAILKLILSNSNFLLLDEPTNHLDIDSKEVLEEALLEYDGTIFTISHDRYFLNTVSDKILVLSPEGVTEYMGNYDYYLDKKNQQLEMEELADINQTDVKTKTQIKEERKREKEIRQKENKEKAKVKELERKIELLEKEINGLEQMLCLEEIYSSPEKSKEVNQEKNEKEKKLEGLYEKWTDIMG